jgi:cysteine desulfurase
MHRVYLDNNATTPLLPAVLEAMLPFFGAESGNASSIHHHGQHARAAVEQARESVAAMVNARPAEIVFTSGGTEADNLALFGLARPGDHILTSAVEHHAVLNACKRLEHMGCEVTYLPVDENGLIDPGDVRRSLRGNTRLISVMMANNETGVLQPLEEIGKIAAEADIFFHTDAVQAAGKSPIDVAKLGVDLLSLSAHKFHGPQGAGALYVRRGTLLQPMLYGGRHERGRRAGTENVAGIAGMGKAAQLSVEGFTNGEVARLCQLRNRIEHGILEQVEGVTINGGGAPRIANTSSVCFGQLEGEALVIALDLKGVAASTGAACSSGAIEPSHVLTAMGLSPDQARASLRFSLGKQNTSEDVDLLLQLLPGTVERLRELTPAHNVSGAGSK